MPLWQAIETVGAQAGLKVSVPWLALEELGVGRSAPVTVALDRPTAAAALAAVLSAGTDNGGVPLCFALRGDTVEIATRASLRRMTEVRVYDVADLIAPAPPQPGGATGRDAKAKDKPEPQRSPESAVAPGAPVAGDFRNAEEVGQWLKETIDPESWRDARGGIGSVRVLRGRYDGLVVVTQTYDNHREIARVLASLRGLRPADGQPADVPAKAGE
jgi:hypothetical protein